MTSPNMEKTRPLTDATGLTETVRKSGYVFPLGMIVTRVHIETDKMYRLPNDWQLKWEV